MQPSLLAAVSIALSVGAQFALRSAVSGRTASSGFDWSSLLEWATNGRLWFGLLLYALSAVAWLKVLSVYEVSKAYPLVGAGFALSAIIGWYLGEQVNIVRITGVALICFGVYLVARS